ncbi:uncharacterized protein TNCV_2707711 [Trichonephila clavipes]|nr:uncharacterized protein TNCV_2707711 [Trichonephila clavipes]
MPKRKRGLKTDEIQKVLADLEDEIFDDSDSDCELENEKDDLISAQRKINWNAALQDGPDNRDVRVSRSAGICSPITSRDVSQDVKPFSCLKYNIVNMFVSQNFRVQYETQIFWLFVDGQ